MQVHVTISVDYNLLQKVKETKEVSESLSGIVKQGFEQWLLNRTTKAKKKEK